MGSEQVLTARALNRAYLARQGLLERGEAGPSTVTRGLIALQGQATHPPYTALWNRIEQLTTHTVDSAFTDGTLVRLALFRSTIHVIAGDEVHALRTLTIPLLRRDFPPHMRAAMAAVDRPAAIARMRALAEAEPISWSALGRAVQHEFPVVDVAGESTVRMLSRLARNFLPMVAVPPSMLWGDNTPGRYSPHHSVDQPPLDASEIAAARVDLVRRFVAAHGPTSAAALTAFTGVSGWPQVFAELAEEFVRVEGPTGTLVDLPDAPRPGADVPAPVRLMAEWDSALHSRTDDGRLVPPALKSLVYTKNGIMPATVLVDGLVDGTWRFRATPQRATVTVVPCSRWTQRVRREVEQEAERYLGFAAPGVPATVVID